MDYFTPFSPVQIFIHFSFIIALIILTGLLVPFEWKWRAQAGKAARL